MNKTKTGEWAFLISVIIAILAGLAAPWATSAWVTVLLVVLGVIVYLVNSYEKDSIKLLVAFIALTFVMSTTTLLLALNVIPYLGTIIVSIITNVIVFLAPIAVIVAVKAIEGITNKK